jgi:integrase
MASIQRLSNGRYRAQVEKLKVRDSRVFDGKREAAEWAARREHEILTQARVLPGERLTLRDALVRYRDEVTSKKRGWRRETVFLEALLSGRYPLPLDAPLARLAAPQIAEFRDYRLRSVKSATARREMTVLGSVLEIARREWQWIGANPIADVRKPPDSKHRERVISPLEIRRQLRAMGYVPRQAPRSITQAAACCFLMALCTGMRAGELCGLTWNRVAETVVALPDSKNGEGRRVPLSPAARRIVARMRGFDSRLVFGLSVSTLDALFRRGRIEARGAGYTFHDARHTAATRIGLAGKIDVLSFCRIFGWKDVRRALTYFNPTAEQLAERL